MHTHQRAVEAHLLELPVASFLYSFKDKSWRSFVIFLKLDLQIVQQLLHFIMSALR